MNSGSLALNSFYRETLRPILKDLYNLGPFACPACGRHARLRRSAAMWPELGAAWELTPELYEAFDEREGKKCTSCGNSLRARQLASVIVEHVNLKIGTTASNLRDLCDDPRVTDLTVAEINGSGGLHQFLQALPRLYYSEYGGAPGVPSEDLSSLSYDDGTFDLVITSDTLEHVPMLRGAFSEIRRVLKPDGVHIFTVPVIWDRVTRARAELHEGELVYLLPPSFHGGPSAEYSDFLVIHEFGRDFETMVRSAGFELEIVQDPRNPTVTTFVSRPLGCRTISTSRDRLVPKEQHA